jgi:hypothetical protein
MPDLKISDSLGNPMDISKVNWTSASSLHNYLKSDLLHLAVAPDYVKVKDQPLSQAISKPASFTLSVQHDFQLGGGRPEIDITPGAQVQLQANATAGANLLYGDPFNIPATVPDGTGYVGFSIQGSLDLGVSGSSGDLTFGVDLNKSVTLGFLKAFDSRHDEPTLWEATASAFSSFVIPASVEDLKHLNQDDICTVSGQGTLTVSGSVDFYLPLNPLASVNLPLNVGTLAVQNGVMTGLSVSLSLTGSYQVRVEQHAGGTVRLSYLRDREASFQTDISASAGVSVDLNTTDLLSKVLGVIGTNKVDPKALDGLSPDQISTFNSMLKAGIDHSLRASLDLALANSIDNQVTFQYDIQPAKLDWSSTDAVNRALRGDLSRLTAWEETMGPDGTLAPGVKLLNSVFSTAKTSGFALKLNLLGIVNLVSSSQLLNNCEFLFDPASGDVTIRETAESDKLSAVVDPYKRQDALRKAIFESVLVTTTYVVSRSVTMPALCCEAAHFAMNNNASRETTSDYTNWFIALNVLRSEQQAEVVHQASNKGKSTCVVRVPLDDSSCENLFFDSLGRLHERSVYLEIGRRALQALLDPALNPVDQFRYNFLDDDTTWQKAVSMGPSAELRTLLPLSSTDSRFGIVLNDISGDLYDIVWWADSMQKAGAALHDIRSFLAGRTASNLAHDPDFARRRNDLQKLMLGVVRSSKVRFREPWGLVCLHRAAGSPRASGKLTAGSFVWQTEAAAVASGPVRI